MARYAVISVSDKTDLIPVGKAFDRHRICVMSTSGTYDALKEGGVPVTQVSAFTGAPEILGGRVKTLHDRLAACILYRRDNERHIADMDAVGYYGDDIDFVIVNLYPFEQKVASGADDATCIENIDIGGPALVREAAKNHESVCVITDPDDYPALLAELDANGGYTTLEFRRRMAAKAFALTARYDAAIADFFERDQTEDRFPITLRQVYDREPLDIRYAENPHQTGAVYRQRGYGGITVLNAEVLSGKALSYNNLGDLDATLDLLLEFSDEGSDPFACLLKHTNPCGAACASTLAKAYRDAYETDPLSAFGCIIGLNRIVDIDTAQLIHDTELVECILAPGYTDEAFALLRKKKQRRILAHPDIVKGWPSGELMNRYLRGGLLRQEMNDHKVDPDELRVVTDRPPTDEELRSLQFAWRVVKHCKSNAVLLVQGTKTVGIGMGDTSRVDVAITATRRAGERAKKSKVASDAFFPKPDGVTTCTDAGATAFIQPGGSKGDQEAIDAANAAGAAMVFTGHRCFKH